MKNLLGGTKHSTRPHAARALCIAVLSTPCKDNMEAMRFVVTTRD